MRNKKRVVGIVVGFLMLVTAVFGVANFANQKDYQEGVKSVEIQIRSERDDYESVDKVETDCETLGELLRELEYCWWEESDYGIYITGFYELSEDIENQYWWCITVNNESVTTGADEIPLEDGSSYEFTLTQGW